MIQYGVQFQDGSVMHPWNGRTQKLRAEEAWFRLRKQFPNDNIQIVIREHRDDPWHPEPDVFEEER